ncbi:MAG: YetF domain-containing protein [Balneolaceae bacterium]
MELILRTVFIYLFITIVFRLSGKRSLSNITTIDFVLLLIIGESVQQALVINDSSIVGAMMVIGTLVTMDLSFARLSKQSNLFDKISNGIPVIILKDGELLKKRMDEENIEIEDVLEFARRSGLDKIDQIKYAVLEKDGQISIIAK